MLNAPPDLTADQISSALDEYWGIVASDVDYAAVGHGSYNWVVQAVDGLRWFVKADRTSGSEFRRSAYLTAAILRDAGLDVVHAVIRDRTGELTRPVSPTWGLAVLPFIEGRNPDFTNNAERALIAAAVGRLHAHAPIPDAAPRWAPGFRQPELRHLLAHDLDKPWTSGPYGERARALINASAAGIERLLDMHDQLVERLLTSDQPWVPTHGEPHGGNTMLDRTGEIRLIDCDGMMLAPRERDLWLLLCVDHERPRGLDNTEVMAAYHHATGPVQPRPDALELFRAEWHLSDISTYGQQFSQPHNDTADFAAHWRTLNNLLPADRNWPHFAQT